MIIVRVHFISRGNLSKLIYSYAIVHLNQLNCLMLCLEMKIIEMNE